MTEVLFETDEAALEELLASLKAERVLDVATGRADFLAWLLESLGETGVGIAVDDQRRAVEAVRSRFPDNSIVPVQMDAVRLAFPTGLFDLVAISQSLHHLPSPQSSLEEMQRVLRPGGVLLMREMYADGQTEAQLTHVALHHWWAAIDTARGISHRITYSREELAGMFLELAHEHVRCFDFAEPEGDPFDAETVEQLEEIIDRYQGFAEPLPQAEVFQRQGEELREQLQRVGFQGAAQLVMLGWTSA